jgi:hypothetical protein
VSNYYAEDIPASLFPSQVTEAGPPILGTFGSISLEPFATYDRDSHCLKMCQDTLPLGLPEFSPTLPTSGILRNGSFYRRQPLVPRTLDSDYSLWPTPVAQEDGKSPEAHLKMRANLPGGPRRTISSLQVMAKATEAGLWPTPQAHDWKKGDPKRVGRFGTKHGGRNLNDSVALWPTPTAGDSKRSGSPDSRANSEEHTGISLADAAKLWPTPTAGDAKGAGNRNLEGSKAHAGVSLTDAVLAGNSSTPRRVPTPLVGDAKGSRWSKSKTQMLTSVVGGRLNPNWVEWLMGFPIGWTDLEQSVTPWSPKSPNSSATP